MPAMDDARDDDARDDNARGHAGFDARRSHERRGCRARLIQQRKHSGQRGAVARGQCPV